MSNPIESLFIKVLEGVADIINKRREKQEISPSAVVIGRADRLYQPKRKEVVFINSTQSNHYYILGSTGSGKSKAVEFLIRQHIQADHGFCLIDPHGDLYQNILSFIAGHYVDGNLPDAVKQLSKRLVLFDPTCTKWTVGFNPLEVLNTDAYIQSLEFMSFIKKHWSGAYSGPRLEETFLNTMITLSLNKLTLLEAKTLLTDASFRNTLVSDLPEGENKTYWYRYNSLSDSMQATYREPILTRLAAFLSIPQIQNIVTQKKSTIHFRELMDKGKWILINLSKGSLKTAGSLLAEFIVAKIRLSAMSRIDISENKRRPFFLIVDEFQTFQNNDFESVLSEARKYKLSMTIVHQNLDQINRQLRSAILGNTSVQMYFRLSNQDATAVADEIGPREKAIIQRRLVDLNPREAYLKIKGQRPRLIKTCYVPPSKGTLEAIETLKELSMSYHARPRHEVEREIANRIRSIYGRGEMPGDYNPENDSHKSSFAPVGTYEEGDDW
jgi:type IV secretory pathway TraG/TraD family ATPase VirD4